MSNGGIDVGETLAREQLRQTFVDLLCDARSLVNKTCVQLNKTRASGDLFPCIFRRKDPPTPISGICPRVSS